MNSPTVGPVQLSSSRRRTLIWLRPYAKGRSNGRVMPIRIACPSSCEPPPRQRANTSPTNRSRTAVESSYYGTFMNRASRTCIIDMAIWRRGVKKSVHQSNSLNRQEHKERQELT